MGDLAALLASLSLESYASKFADEGYDDLETLGFCTRDELSESLEEMEMSADDIARVVDKVAAWKPKTSDPPVFVAFFGIGTTLEQEREAVAPLLESVRSEAGIIDAFMCPFIHHRDPVPATWQMFMSEAVEEIERVANGRPLVVFGYSAGCVAAHGIATRLPGRVRKLVALAMRPDFNTVGPEVWNCETAGDFAALEYNTVMELAVAAWFPHLAALVRMPFQQWPAAASVLSVEMKPYATPSYPVYPDASLAEYGAKGPGQVDAPIYAVASTGEIRGGEHPDRMARWRGMTTEHCDIDTFDGGIHGNLIWPDNTGRCVAFDLVVAHLTKMSRAEGGWVAAN
jgi:pimeloyl-ACP methyl ester carboxylesterase